MRKKLFYSLFFLIFLLGGTSAQIDDFVRIEGKKFKKGQEDFFAVVCNYETVIFHENGLAQNENDFPKHFAARAPSYILTGDYIASGISNQAQATASMKHDFDYIKSLGFNTIRIGFPYGMTAAPGSPCSGENIVNTTGPALSSYNISVPNWSYCNSDRRVIDISNNNKLLLDIIESVLKTAEESGLKVIVITGEVSHVAPFITQNPPNQAVVDGYVNYLQEFANRFKYNSTLLAIDFGNEPDNKDQYKGTYSKNQVCAITKLWNDAVKSNSQILTTIGLMDIETSLFLWDMDLLNVDFASIHPYPGFADPYYLTDMNDVLEGMKSRFYWLSKYLKIPWMVGETSITAHKENVWHPINSTGYWDSNPTTKKGTLNDQAIFLESTIKSCYELGGLGYSWWAFMDNTPCEYTQQGCPGAFWGLVYTNEPYFNNQTSISTYNNKPAALKIANFNSLKSNLTVNPQIQPANNYYYNILHSPTTNYIMGQIKDNNNLPVQGAMIIAKDWAGQHIGQTFTNESGEFLLYSGVSSLPKVVYSALGCSNSAEINYPPQNVGVWNLTRVADRPNIQNTISYQSENLYNISRTNYVKNNATFSNNYNLFSGTQNITAGETIYLNSGFSAKYGSIFNARIGKYYDDCADISFKVQSSETKDPLVEVRYSNYIYPNPTQDKFTISLNPNDELPQSISVRSVLGNEVKKINSVTERNLTIDLGDCSDGVYIVNVNYADKTLTNKIVKTSGR